VDEAALGQVPTANRAQLADTLDGLDSTAFLRSDAKAADAERLDGLDSTAFLRSDAKAADAELLDGRDASDFAPAGELHNSGRVTMSDTTPAFDSQYTETTILTVGDLTIEGLCAVDFGGVTANDRAIVQASISGGRSGSIIYSDPAVPPENWGSSSSASLGLAYVFAGVNEVRSGHGMFVGPGDQVISASASAEVNAPDAPCVFGVTAIGP
jgi:hypothetical protein